jgi:hypothetical protein
MRIFITSSSPNIIRMSKSSKMRWAGHIEYIGRKECIWNFGGKARRRPKVIWRIILRCTLKK